ncbi:MAG: thioredoxin family protein [Synechococcus sp.]
MVLTPSTMLPLASPLPNFALPVAGTGTNSTIQSEQLPARPVLLMLLCSHCPFVKHIEAELSRIDSDYSSQITLLGVASNSWLTHPQDGPEALTAQAQRNGWRFPYLLDQDQTLAKALRAACTPEFYLFAPEDNGTQTLRYRGQLDDSRPGQARPVDGHDLRAALEALLHNKAPDLKQKPSIGCNIKWHPGQEPQWFGETA